MVERSAETEASDDAAEAKDKKPSKQSFMEYLGKLSEVKNGETTKGSDGEYQEKTELEQLIEGNPEIVNALQNETRSSQEQMASGGSSSTHPEQIGNIVQRLEGSGSSGLATTEMLNRRKEAETKKDIKLSKKQAKSLKKEREELKEQQEKFEKKLDVKLKKYKDKHHKTQEDAQYKEKPHEFFADDPNKQMESSELQKIIETNDNASPEVILERVEVAAAHDLPIEKMYETRHEAKDGQASNSKDTPVATDAPVSMHQSINEPIVAPQKPTNDFSSDLNKTKKVKKASARKLSPLYTQAVLGGFMAAVILLVLIMVLVIFS